jgi:cyclomaltodextrinase
MWLMAADTPNWVRDAVFYQIFPDRFAQGSDVPKPPHLEDWDAAPTPLGFKGGDLYGIAEQLDYLTELGIDALYLCPIFASACNHRYHTYDYYQVDPLLGGNDAFRLLLDRCHQRDIKVILDGVFNHASRGLWQFHHVLENGAASPYRDWFHFDPARLNGERPFQPYPSDTAAAQLASGSGSLDAIGYSAWWNLPALPKFNTSCPEAREFLLRVGEHWIEFGIDGWRLDVPNEIQDEEFWREFRRRVRAIRPDAYIVGEVWGDATQWLQGDMWDAVMNYQVTAACLGFFGGPNLDLELVRKPSSFSQVCESSSQEFAQEVNRLLQCYPQNITAVQLNLLDSHDMPRFVTCCGGDQTALQMAWLFVCLLPGAPCIYYGDEVGVAGRHDPDCRRGFPWKQDRQDRQLFDWYQQCIQWRRQAAAFRRGSVKITAVADGTILMTSDGDRQVAAVFNTRTHQATVDLSVHSSLTGNVTVPGRTALVTGL